MSRSGYDNYGDSWDLIRYRGAVASAIRGKRGQKLLKELLIGLDNMSEKRLIANELESDGEFCVLGVAGKARGIEMSGIDPEDSELVAKTFDIADALAREIVNSNDDGVYFIETPEARWVRMRDWIEFRIN